MKIRMESILNEIIRNKDNFIENPRDPELDKWYRKVVNAIENDEFLNVMGEIYVDTSKVYMLKDICKRNTANQAVFKIITKNMCRINHKPYKRVKRFYKCLVTLAFDNEPFATFLKLSPLLNEHQLRTHTATDDENPFPRMFVLNIDIPTYLSVDMFEDAGEDRELVLTTRALMVLQEAFPLIPDDKIGMGVQMYLKYHISNADEIEDGYNSIISVEDLRETESDKEE